MSDYINKQDVLDAFRKELSSEYNKREYAIIMTALSFSGIESILNEIKTADVVERKRGEWIPCSERLPDNDDIMLVSCRTKKGVNSVNRAYYADGFWHGSGSMSGVTAWMLLPEPYTKENDRKGN